MNGDPVIDHRNADQIVEQGQALRAVYTPEWTATDGDHGMALLSIFGRLMEIMISRLNRVPEKNFLAFLDTAGVHLLPPKAARVPVKFIASAGAKKDGVVPAGTQLATAPPSGQEPLTFETEKKLTVSRSRLAHLYSHDPSNDQYTDQQAVVGSNEKSESASFQPFIGWSLIPHRLYLSQDTVFQINHPTKLTLTITLASAPSPSVILFFKEGLRWTIASPETDITPPAEKVTPSGNIITVVLDSPQPTMVGQKSVNGIDGYWILAQTKNVLLPGLANVKIASVKVTSEASGIKPSFAFFNTASLDTNREFYPFGERPKTFDTFFLAIPEALSRTGSTITVLPGYQKGVAGSSGVELTYEFWGGSAWGTLGVVNKPPSGNVTVTTAHQFADATNAFTADSGPNVNIQFRCPEIKLVEVNGKEDYWLRVRITKGNYGEDAKMELTEEGRKKQPKDRTLNDWTYSPPSFAPPIINALSVSYKYLSSQDMTAVRTEDNFAVTAVEPTGEFQAFKAPAAPEDQTACYLGFDSPFSDSPFSPNAVSFYIAVKETTTPSVVWEYWDGTRWKNLGVQDGTTNFTESGMVEFIGPADAKRKNLFSVDAYWLRARLEQRDDSLINLLGIYLNTVWAKNCITLTEELLGSSTETPGETFTLSRSPVLDGLQIEVRESERPSDEDLATLFAEEGEDAVSPVQQGEGTGRESWVRWHRVDHFRFSGKNSRHYVVDWFSGRVQFGDGIRGMVPLAGKGNIRAKWYQAGGGANGNVARNTVTVLKRAIPFVDKAVNVDAAGGGSDGETVEQVKVRGPQSIKNRDRAVTWEDFEWLAKEASFQVARARCLPAKTKDDAGKIRLIIVPRSDEPKPLPSQGLIRQVEEYVSTRERRIGTANLSVIEPRYVEVSVQATVFPEKLEEADLVRRLVQDRLTELFHPLRGGPDGTGWEFGRDVYVSEVCKVIEDSEGVHHVENVALSSAKLDSIQVPDDSLVASGEHVVTIGGAAETMSGERKVN